MIGDFFTSVGGVILWVTLFFIWVALAVLCARNRHWVLFIIGFFFPLLWLIGALIRPRVVEA
jgi:hypothetical protein